MKRLLILIFALAVLASPAWGGGLLIGSGGNSIACTTPICQDTCVMSATEAFEGGSSDCGDGTSVCINTWTGTGTPTGISNSPSGAPDNTACQKSMRFNSVGAPMYSVFDSGSAIARSTYDIDIYMLININSTTLAELGIVLLANWSNLSSGPTNNVSGKLALKFSNPNHFLYMQSSTNSAELEINLNEWNLIQIHLDGTAANSFVSKNGGTTQGVDYASFTRYNAVDGRYLFIGGLDNASGENVDMHFGYVAMSKSIN